MTTLYIVRHAQAEGNLYRRAQGWYDGQVTATGLLQIRALEERFRDLSLDAVYASDLRRTQTTAQAAAGPRGLSIIIDPDLKEIGMGIYEDKTFGDLAYHYPEGSRLFYTCSPLWAPEKGESFQQVQDRMLAAVKRIAAAHPGQTAAIFSHGTAIKCLLSGLRGKHPSQTPELGHPENTAVTRIDFDGETPHIRYENDASHLPAELRSGPQRSSPLEAPAPQVWFDPLDPEKGQEFYLRAWRESWAAAQADPAAFEPADLLAQGRRQHTLRPQAVEQVFWMDRPAGLLQLDVERERSEGLGWVSLFYVEPSLRRQGIGIQLLGEAVSLCRAQGWQKLGLVCAPENGPALAFYRRYGFVETGRAPGAGRELLRLEKEI